MRGHWLLLTATLLSACASESGHRGGGHDANAALPGDESDDAGRQVTTDDAASQSERDSGGESSARDAGLNGGGETGKADDEPPAPCAASVTGSAPLGKDTFLANTGKSAVANLTYTNVGAAGAYAEVVSGWSKASGCKGDDDGMLCKTVYRKEKRVAGPLAPFDEEMTFVFGGPIELYQLAVYSPRAGAWQRDAYWDRCTTEGLAFAGNKHWHECAGFVESYVNADGSKESTMPIQFAGSIAAGTEVHVMSNGLCTGADACGYSSGLALRGFKGDAAGSKLFAVTLRMPLGSKTPAYWILPAQVVRSNQYGCNCRGAGSDPVYKGGCGELDVAEILGGVTTSLEATSTLYSFQDITGGGSVTFARPVQEAATFVVIFDASTRQIAIRRLSKDALVFSAQISNERVAQLLSESGTVRALR